MDTHFIVLFIIFMIVQLVLRFRSQFGVGGSFRSGTSDASERKEPIFDEALTKRVRFDATGWTFVSRDRGWLWRDQLGNVLGLQILARHLGPIEPDGDVVAYGRDNISFGNSLVEARPAHVKSFYGLVIIDKSKRPPGYAYSGRLHVFLEHQTIVFSLFAIERGMTGVREASMVQEALSEGRISLPDNPSPSGTKIPGWFVDPYDPARNDRTICSVSDDLKYDARFPGHPLSRIRQTLGQIEASFEMRGAVPDPDDPWPYPPLTASDDKPQTIN